jgi:hypothetical protein
MSELVKLNKESSESDIKIYFQSVFEISQSGEEFPVDFDLVWPLVYSRRDNAIRDLKEGAIENIDYILLLKNEERNFDETLNKIGKRGGRNKISYKLTVSCMEWFVARKKREVFEVYRQVFHKMPKILVENTELKNLLSETKILREKCNAMEDYRRALIVVDWYPDSHFGDEDYSEQYRRHYMEFIEKYQKEDNFWSKGEFEYHASKTEEQKQEVRNRRKMYEIERENSITGIKNLNSLLKKIENQKLLE